MEKELEKTERKELTTDDIKTLTDVGVIPKDSTPALVKLFGRFCLESGLNPFKGQVHFIKRGATYKIQTGIDGYRSIADRTGLYAGSDEPIFDELPAGKPTKATVTVYKFVNGVKCAFTASARWSEYAPKESNMAFMWVKMPYLMLSKCAESLALRKAFPNELSGTYTDEEMQQSISQPNEDVGGKESPPKQPVRHDRPVGSSNFKNVCTGINENNEPCGKVISSSKVIEYSNTNFGKTLCFDCQKIEKNRLEENDVPTQVPQDNIKDAEYTEEFPELHDEDEVI